MAVPIPEGLTTELLGDTVVLFTDAQLNMIRVMNQTAYLRGYKACMEADGEPDAASNVSLNADKVGVVFRREL